MAVMGLPLLCGLVFFWPDRSIANVDDLFFVPWAMEFAESGRHWNSLLAVQFPGLENYHLQPRLHLIFAGLFFSVSGTDTTALLAFEFLCFALTNLVFVIICLRLDLRLAALFTPLLFAPLYVVTGFRLELTGALIFVSGLSVSLPLLRAEASRARGQAGPRAVMSIFSKFLFGIAPLAAPSLFAWSLGAIAVLEIWRLATRQARLLRIICEGLAALLLALAVFALSIDFEFAEFLEQFTFHAGRSTGGGFNDEAILRAVLFAGASALVFRHNHAAAAICTALAAGQFLAAFLHDKALIRNLAASMVFLIALDAAVGTRWLKVKATLFATLFLALSANFFSFYFISERVENSEAVIAAYEKDLSDGQRVFVDETMAQHYLNQNTLGALAWTWGGTFPKGRPTSLYDLEEGDVWYVSEYTILGYLKGRHDIAEKVWSDPDYRRVPQFSCVLGRQSCNLPVERWRILRLEKLDEGVSVKIFGDETTSRILPHAQ
ncbi:hypothetical protein [uncultured Roseibium sp.]|uniref:hypothetical protein n=1 Tax=uncultured Roseibium sp. TaxID=1936171 RepID=UPI0026390790|nr:hypothetical protein [uncultured Roseibium sp.]